LGFWFRDKGTFEKGHTAIVDAAPNFWQHQHHPALETRGHPAPEAYVRCVSPLKRSQDAKEAHPV
jgi:hypothetical protein